jgi:hypothetical protein
MQDMPKAAAGSRLREAAWREQLLALNPRARGLTFNEGNEEFAAARRRAVPKVWSRRFWFGPGFGGSPTSGPACGGRCCGG